MNEVKTYDVEMTGMCRTTQRVQASSLEDAFRKASHQVAVINDKSDIYVDFNYDWSPEDIEEVDVEQDAKDEAIRGFVTAKYEQLGHDRYCDIQDTVNKTLNKLWEIA